MMMRFATFCCLACAVTTIAAADDTLSTAPGSERIEWTMGRTIELPVRVSSETIDHSRVIIFPNKLSSVNTTAPIEFIEHKASGNVLTFKVWEPDVVFNFEVVDEQNNFYVLRVQAAGHAVSPQVFITLPEALTRRTDLGTGPNLDARIADLVAHMVGGRQIPGVRGSPAQTITEAGEIIPGEIIYQDDATDVILWRRFRAGGLKGYHVILRVRTERPYTLAYRKLRVPQMLAIYCPESVVFSPTEPAVTIAPGTNGSGAAVNLYIVGR